MPHLLSNIYYLCILVLFLVGVVGYIWTSWAHHAINSFSAVLAIVIALIFAAELIREFTILFTQAVPELSYTRVIILRLEHTWFGICIWEVINRVRHT